MTADGTTGGLQLFKTKETIDDERAKRGVNDNTLTTEDSSTILWRSAARTVTLVTGAASLSVRTGFKLGTAGLSIGRWATYSAIGLNQTVLETVLRAAGNDPDARNQLVVRQGEAENLVDRWVTSLHRSLTATSIVAGAGFYVAENAIKWTSDSSLLGLHFLNAIFGDTESSRAVAAIVSLMKEELKKPGLDGSNNQIHTLELLTTVASFLFLQRSGRRQTEMEWRNAGGDATVWDIVIDDKGFRADVIGTRRPDVIARSRSVVQSPLEEDPTDMLTSVVEQAEDELLAHPAALNVKGSNTLTDEEIRHRILEQLPAGSRATITSDTTTIKTIRVDIHGSSAANIEAPPGTVMVSEQPNLDNSLDKQTIVFKTASKVGSRAEVKPNERLSNHFSETAESFDAAEEDGIMMRPSPEIPPPQELDPSEGRSPRPASHPSDDSENVPPTATSPVANQKKVRKSVQDVMQSSGAYPGSPSQSKSRRERVTDSAKSEKNERSGALKKAWKSLSPDQSFSALHRVVPSSSRSRRGSGSGFTNSLADTLKPLTLTRGGARKPAFQTPTTQPTTPLMSSGGTTPTAYEGQGTGYFTVHEQRRESTYSQTDTYSIHSNESRPPSPTMSRAHLRASNSISKTRSQTEISIQQTEEEQNEQGSSHHRRTQSFVPSLYSMGTKNSGEDTLVLAPKTPVPRRSIFEDNQMLIALAKDGKVPGQFPSRHLIWTLRRFGRFASAVYGGMFMRIMGLTADAATENNFQAMVKATDHHEHASFAQYTGMPAETIIKSSWLEPGNLSSGSEQGFTPIIHVVTIDLESKAIVLTCRGTLGFEDLLTDMACDYADIYWQGQAYKVHRGIRDSARRLMDSSGGNRIMAILKASLEEYPEFGLVFTGHSLGGAVAAVLAIMLSEPSRHEPGENDAPAFITAKRPKLLPSRAHSATTEDIPPVTLPAGRPIHVYTFGSPACVSPALRVASRGLITTIINANDIVPYLSLGTLHDFRAVARRLKDDVSGAFNSIKGRASDRVFKAISAFLWAGDMHSEAAAGPPPAVHLAGDGLGEDTWMWNELVEMRKVMVNEKLVPPGEIFTIDSTRVFDRDLDETTMGGAEQARHYAPLGRPATRVQLKWVKDVERRFTEVRFQRSMFQDHSPWHYENNLSALERGVYDEA